MSVVDHSRHLQELESFFADSKICRDSFRLLIHFAIRLAAAGHIHAVLATVEKSPEAALFLPLADGLRLHLGLPIESTGRSRMLAVQIASKIAEEAILHPDTGPAVVS
jgi:hypothetical protein